MTLIYEFDLDILKMYMYLCTKNKVCLFLGRGLQKLESEQDRHTHAHGDRQTDG